LFDGAAGVGHDLSQLSFGGFDLAVDIGKGGVTLVQEMAGVRERGGCGRFTCEELKGHGGKLRDGQGEIGEGRPKGGKRRGDGGP